MIKLAKIIHVETLRFIACFAIYIRCLRSDNDTFTRFQSLDVWLAGLVLFSNKWGYIGLDTTSAKSDNDNTNNKTRE